MSKRPTHEDYNLQTRRQLNLLREAFSRPAASAGGRVLLREDLQNLDNTARAELQQAMATALETALDVNDVKEEGGIHTVSGVLHLGQNVSFAFTTQRPTGCVISCQDLEMSDRTAEILGKLQAYYASWYEQTTTGAPAAQPGAPAL